MKYETDLFTLPFPSMCDFPGANSTERETVWVWERMKTAAKPSNPFVVLQTIFFSGKATSSSHNSYSPRAAPQLSHHFSWPPLPSLLLSHKSPSWQSCSLYSTLPRPQPESWAILQHRQCSSIRYSTIANHSCFIFFLLYCTIWIINTLPYDTTTDVVYRAWREWKTGVCCQSVLQLSWISEE